MGILFGTAICWIEGYSRGVEHSVFGYPFGSEGDRPGLEQGWEWERYGEICTLFPSNPAGQWMISASMCPKASLAHHPWMVCLVHFGRALVQLLIQKRLQRSGLQWRPFATRRLDGILKESSEAFGFRDLRLWLPSRWLGMFCQSTLMAIILVKSMPGHIIQAQFAHRI